MNARFDAAVWSGFERRLAEVERFIPDAPSWGHHADRVTGGLVRRGTAFGMPDARRSTRQRRLGLALTATLVILAILAAVLLVGAPNPQVDRRAEPFGPFGIYRSSDTGGSAAVLPDGRVLIASGTWTQMGQAMDAGIKIWDPTDGLTGTEGPAIGRVGSVATLLLDGRILVTGGFAGPHAYGTTAVAAADIWDPRSGAFTGTGSMARPRIGHLATLLPDGRVLVIGEGSAEIWDPRTSGFRAAGTYDVRYGIHTATLLPSGDVLVLGPQPAEIWRAATEEFTGAPGLSPAFGYMTATPLLDGRVLVIHDRPDRPLAPPVASIVLDAVTSTPAGSLLQPRNGYATTLLWDGRVLITGGVRSDPAGPPLSSVEVFDPAVGSFRELPPLSQPVADHTALLLPDGRVLIVHDVHGLEADPFIYDPSTLPAIP